RWAGRIHCWSPLGRPQFPQPAAVDLQFSKHRMGERQVLLVEPAEGTFQLVEFRPRSRPESDADLLAVRRPGRRRLPPQEDAADLVPGEGAAAEAALELDGAAVGPDQAAENLVVGEEPDFVLLRVTRRAAPLLHRPGQTEVVEADFAARAVTARRGADQPHPLEGAPGSVFPAVPEDPLLPADHPPPR